MDKLKVLVVDDEPNIRDLLSASLRFAGHQVATAANALYFGFLIFEK
jgi:two-component system OmpR family response regulator